MAIKVIGTTVIDDEKRFENITDTDGFYGNFHPSVQGAHVSGTITLNADDPLFILRIEGALTISDMINKSSGKHGTILADVSSSGYDITWGSNFKFVNDTEPNWTTSRYWLINFTVWDSSTILITATSYTGDGASFPDFEGSALGSGSTNGLIVKLNDGTSTDTATALATSNNTRSFNTEPGRTLVLTVFYDPTIGSPCETIIKMFTANSVQINEGYDVYKGGAITSGISTYQDVRSFITYLGNSYLDSYSFNIGDLSSNYFQLGYKMIVPTDLIGGYLYVQVIDDAGDDGEDTTWVRYNIT